MATTTYTRPETMASSHHVISDSDDSDPGPSRYKVTKFNKTKLKHERSLHEISDSEDENLVCTNLQSLKRRHRSSSDDSDKTIDPDEEPDLFKVKSNKRQRKESSDISDESDVTIDLTPQMTPESETEVLNDPSHTRTPKTRNISAGCGKSDTGDHPISETESESGISASPSKPKSNAKLPSTCSSSTKGSPLKSKGKGDNASKTAVNQPRTPTGGTKQIKHASSDKKILQKQRTSTNKKTGHPPKRAMIETVDSDDSDVTVDLEVSECEDRRPMCRYGSKCYRKNPSHLEEFQHPPKHDDEPGPSKPSMPRVQSTSSTSGPSKPSMSRVQSTSSTSGPSKPSMPRVQSTSSTSGPLKKKSPSTTSSSLPGGGSKTPVVPSGGTARTTASPDNGASTTPEAVISSAGSPAETVTDAGPLGFLLTKVVGIKPTHNNRLAMHIKDILSPSMGNLEKSAQFNYMTDINWLVSQYPLEFRVKPLLIVHGCQRREKAALEQEASVYSHIRLCQARLEIMYGTHHTKMMLLVYDKGMRVVIHTSNLIDRDWHQKTQGIWISPLFPRLPTESSTAGDSATFFKRDLLEYIAAYKARPLEDWAKTIRQHDMSSAKVYIIASVPGRHTAEKKSAFGHLKLRKLLQQHGPTPLHVKNWPVLGQFSSIGSLGATKDNWVCEEWLSSLSAARGGASTLGTSATKLKLVYPSKDNVRLSLEGYPAGGSLPYSINTAKKQTWLHNFLHEWKSVYRGRSQASPHIKTYLRASPDWLNIAWFIVTSANLSKAAWGVLEKNGHQLMIRSYELGVLFLPEQFGSVSSFRRMKNITESLKPIPGKQLLFPVPYDLPPTEYTKQDRPWVWDIPYVDKPDTNGNMWCPQ